MVKNFSSGDFVEYVSGLKFNDIRDVVAFSEAYKDAYYKAIDDKAEKDIVNHTFLQYSLVMAILGHIFIKFCNEVFKEIESNDPEVQP
jgi:hypothetical protein